jgi:2-keto-4-pentenoate hydratase/2-oxohepta-3-ene-1,7-dioic acid hydratase in catechol pathway
LRLVTYCRANGARAAGAILPDGRAILDLAASGFPDMLSLVQAGPAGLAKVRVAIDRARDSDSIPLTRIRLLAPLPRPEQIRCFSAFEEHARRSAQAMLKVMASRAPDPAEAEAELQASGRFNVPPLFFERPLYYKGNRFSVVGTEQEIIWPAYSKIVDFELELGCVIGARGRDIARAEAGAYIFGYTVVNDLSARDAQAIEMQAPLGPAKGKDFDGGLAMGPWLVTADEFDRSQATMIVRVNGAEWSRGSASGMHHTFEGMIHYVSQSETIYPGEMFLSGCVGGGSGMELGRYPARGDVIEFEIQGIGVLRNRIV